MTEKQMDNLISVLRDFVMALIVFSILLIVGFAITIGGLFDLMSTLEEMS